MKLYYTYPPHSYLREVGFPDNVLEARVSRIAAYKSLYGQNQPLDQVTSSSVRSDSPKPSVSPCLVWCVSVCLYVRVLIVWYVMTSVYSQECPLSLYPLIVADKAAIKPLCDRVCVCVCVASTILCVCVSPLL